MEIIVENKTFNITSEDLESVQIEFSFWCGRRIKLSSNGEEHQLRFNDLIRGVLAEDATFEENEDKQQMYLALNNLKGRGYPYNGPCEIRIMLWFKQLFGNYNREALLEQLKSKLYEENEELTVPEGSENISGEAGSCNTLATNRPLFIDLSGMRDMLPLIFTYVGRAGCLSLTSTCKLFCEIYNNNLHLRDYLIDFNRLKQCNDLKKFQNNPKPACIQNEISLLLNDFSITKVSTASNTEITELLHYAIALAKINPKSALEIVTPIIESDKSITIQTLAFCVMAAIHKNSTLCKIEGVLQMGTEVAENYSKTWIKEFQEEKEETRIINLLHLFEAFLALDNDRAIKILDEIKNRHLGNSRYLEYNLKRIIYVIKRLHPFEEKIKEKIVELLDKSFNSIRVLPLLDRYDLFGKIAKTWGLFDQEKAIEMLEMALEEFHFKFNLPISKNYSYALNSLTSIAGAFAKFDQGRAFALAKEAFESYEYLMADSTCECESQFVFGCLNQILKIFAANDKKYALEQLEKSKNQLLNSPALLETLFDNKSLDFIVITLEAFALLNPEEALQLAKEQVARVKKIKEEAAEKYWYADLRLLSLTKCIAKKFLQEAIEIAEVADELPHIKFRILMQVVRKRINSKSAQSYIDKFNL